MSVYADYIKERLGWETIEEGESFVYFHFPEPFVCVIEELYVGPSFRKLGVARALADRVVAIARERKCTTLVGRVFVGAKNATEALKVQLAYGFQLHHIDGEKIVLTKEIGD